MSAICDGNIRSIADVNEPYDIQADSASKEEPHLPLNAFVFVQNIYDERNKERSQ